MATVTKRGQAFRITVSLGYDTKGKQIRKTTTFKPPENVTPRKAEKLANNFARDFERECFGAVSLRENMRFSDLCEWYFDNYAPNKLKDVTAYTYKGQVKKHLLPVFGNIKLKDFSPARLTKFFKEIDLNPATCRKLYTIIESIFTRAVEQGFIAKTPCRNVILPKADKIKKSALTDEQTRHLLSLVSEYSQLNTLVKVLLYTGMRVSEALALQWNDIDFSTHSIHIHNSLADVAGKHFLQEPKTKSSVRFIGTSETLEEILKEHYSQQLKIKESIGKGYLYPDMVFASCTGNFLDRSQSLQQFKRLIKNTDYSFASFHTLRHCNATLLINNGIDIKIVSEHLGHSSVAVTGDIYADVLADSRKKVADLISLNLK